MQHGSELGAVLANSGWLMVDRLLRIALAIVVGSWVARHLRPLGYGELAYGIALVAVWQALAGPGQESLLLRDLAREPEQSHRLLGTALRFRLAGGLAGWIGVLISVAVLRLGEPAALLIAAILGAGLLLQALDVVDVWFQSQSRSRAAVLPRPMAYATASLAKIVLILVDAPLAMFAAAVLLDAAVAAVALSFLGAAVSLSLSMLLIPRWGAVGAAWAAVAANFCAAVLSNARLAREYLGLQFRALWPLNIVAPARNPRAPNHAPTELPSNERGTWICT